MPLAHRFVLLKIWIIFRCWEGRNAEGAGGAVSKRPIYAEMLPLRHVSIRIVNWKSNSFICIWVIIVISLQFTEINVICNYSQFDSDIERFMVRYK